MTQTIERDEQSRERQRLILDLNRRWQEYDRRVKDKEQADKNSFWERGVCYGLSLALTRVREDEPSP